MSGHRKKMFGPMFYATLIVAGLATSYSAYLAVQPRLDDWLETRRLGRHLLSPSAQERQYAALRLAVKGPEVFGPYFLEAAGDPRAEVRALGCRSVAHYLTDPDTVVPRLVASAGDPEVVVRVEAARGLGHLIAIDSGASPTWAPSAPLPTACRSDVLAALRRLLKDSSAEIRVQAASSLALVGHDPESVPGLNGAAGDPDGDVRLAASKALMAADGPENPAAIRALLAILSERDASPRRLPALEALNDSGADARERAGSALAGVLSAAKDEVVRHDTIECLIKTGPWATAALPALERIARGDDPELRAIAGLAIAAIQGPASPKGIATLIDLVADPSLPIDRRQAALQAVRAQGPAGATRATPALIRQLGDPLPSVRADAIELLSEIVYEVPAEMPGPTTGK